MRGIAYNRDISDRKARRKRRMIESWHITWYNNLHQYSKNKIHCSCGICSCKTNGHHKCYGRNMNWSSADMRQIERMNYQEEEYNNGEYVLSYAV